jgi:tRNA threonylcarbamoyladenosine biosynthesis protein TsaE
MSAALLDELDLRAPDAAATQAIAVRLAAVALPGDVLCLWGDLGAGKTQFAKGFGAGLGITDTINSPTFVLMAEYRGRLPLFHLDLYRLDDARDALAGGLLDEREGTGVTLIEWPDRMRDLLPNARLDISIEGVGDEPRTIRLATADPSLRRYLAAVR